MEGLRYGLCVLMLFRYSDGGIIVIVGVPTYWLLLLHFLFVVLWCLFCPLWWRWWYRYCITFVHLPYPIGVPPYDPDLLLCVTFVVTSLCFSDCGWFGDGYGGILLPYLLPSYTPSDLDACADDAMLMECYDWEEERLCLRWPERAGGISCHCSAHST